MSSVQSNPVVLTDRQLEVVQSECPQLLVIATAGSGKTRVLTERVRYYVEELEEDPSKMIIATLTNKAADEFVRRLKSSMGSTADLLLAGTLHSICCRIIRENHAACGLPKNFLIYDASDSKTLVANLVENKFRLLKKYVSDNNIYRYLSLAKGNNRASVFNPDSATTDFPIMMNSLLTSYNKYLKDNQILDFSDLIVYCGKYLRKVEGTPDHPNFRHLFVDEYQDINSLQCKIIEIITKSSEDCWLTAVGDIDQSLYSFMGSDIDLVLQFGKQYPKREVISLGVNWRCPPEIVKPAAQLISKNSTRIKYKISAGDTNSKGKISYHEFNGFDEQLDFISQTITSSIRRDKKDFSDFAILARTNQELRDIASYTTLPIMTKERRLPNTLGIRVFLNYLKLAIHPTDSTVNNLASVLYQYSAQSGKNFLPSLDLENLDTGELDTNQLKMVEEMSSLADIYQTKTVHYLIEYLLLYSQLQKYCLPDKRYSARLERLLLLISEKYKDKQCKDQLGDILSMVSLGDYSSLLNEGQDSSISGVNLLTIHSAKGLEFDTVFVPNCEEGYLPPTSCHNKVTEEEERRVFYVAMTRTKKSLYLLRCKQRQGIETIPSRFLMELSQ